MSPEELLLQITIGLIAICANMLSAFSGGGAGLIQLPSLILLGLPFTKALATHKLASIALGIGASIRHGKEKSLLPSFSYLIIICGLPGVFIGSNLIINIPSKSATLALGILTLCLGIYSYTNQSDTKPKEKFKSSLFKKCFGGIVLFLIGVINGSLSSGTGLFVTMWLVSWFGLSYSKAIGYTLVFVGIFWNGTGAAFLVMNNEVQWSWLPVLVSGSLIGGYIGAHFSLIKGEVLVKKTFEIISIGIGLSLITKSLL